MSTRIIIQDKKDNKIIAANKSIILALDSKGSITPHLSPNLGFMEIMQMLQTVQLYAMNLFSTNPKTGEQTQEAKEEMWDYYNTMASSLLQEFIPDKDMRPDLTEEAILAMENKILDEAHAKKLAEEAEKE